MDQLGTFARRTKNFMAPHLIESRNLEQSLQTESIQRPKHRMSPQLID
jgi:hypothetical protein